MSRSDAEALMRQGIELYDLGRYQEAVVMFDRALTLFPRLPKAHYFKGIAQYDLGKYDAAVESYDNALALDPSDINAWYNKAATLGPDGKEQRGARNLRPADRAQVR